MRLLETIQWATRALHRETLGFHFDYPLEHDVAAGPKDSLRYYIYSDKLSWSLISCFDADGVPLISDRLYGPLYHSGYIAWYGLVQLGKFLRRSDPMNKISFLTQVSWLEQNAVFRGQAAVWPGRYDLMEGPILLKAPWVTSHDQGLVISALVRAWRLTKRRHLVDLFERATKAYELHVDDGGIRDAVDGHTVYPERPGYPSPGILDGFVTSLLGLYDVHSETGDPAVTRLLLDGVAGLKHLIRLWDYRGKWSWYSNREYLCPPQYHILNRLLLSSLGRVMDEPILKHYAERWNPDLLSPLERLEIFLVFLLTKNACRIKYQTWLYQRAHTLGSAQPAPVTIANFENDKVCQSQ